MSNNDIFKELNAQIKAAEGTIPDTFTVGGQVYSRVGAPPASSRRRRGQYKHPKTGKVSEEDLESVLINVAPHADRITLDGVIYLANRSYDVPAAVATTIRDIVAQTWKHEAQTGGANSYNAGSVRNPAHMASRPGVGFAA